MPGCRYGPRSRPRKLLQGPVTVSGGGQATAEALVAGAPDPVLAWNAIATQLSVAAKKGAVGFIDETIVHTAIYDAVESIHGRYTPFASRPRAHGPASAYAAAASFPMATPLSFALPSCAYASKAASAVSRSALLPG